MPSQDNRVVSVTTPLGSTLLFSRMSGSEEMSRLFDYEVDLLVENKNQGTIVSAGFPVKDVLGQAMTIAVELPANAGTRYFHGLVTQFRHYGVQDECFYTAQCYALGYGF
ncbi:MAG: contractile injection system protein, VgrG/Pvc8 family [Methylococcales bacterium]|nr:contractile injection system protein, VgrG/Pvc8 family [Methylococcales bacterium]